MGKVIALGVCTKVNLSGPLVTEESVYGTGIMIIMNMSKYSKRSSLSLIHFSAFQCEHGVCVQLNSSCLEKLVT